MVRARFPLFSILSVAATVLVGSVTAAEDKIPPLEAVPTALPHDDYMMYERRRLFLAEDFAKFKKAADFFSAKPAKDQTDAEFTTLKAERQRQIEIRTAFNQAIRTRITELSAAAGFKTFILPAVKAEGDVRFVTGDGRIFTGDAIAGATIDNRTKIVTGSGSKGILLLPDATSFTIGPNSEMVLDDFVFDPVTSTTKLAGRLAKGGFRWVTGKAAGPRKSKIDVETPVIAIGIRGTDFSCTVNPDGSGNVRLYSGELDLRDRVTGQVSILQAGWMVTFADGKSSEPLPLPAESP